MRIPVTIWEQLDMAFGSPIWLGFMEKGELVWKDSTPYRVYVQGEGIL